MRMLVALLALSACALPSTAAFDANMAGFVGRSETELVGALGVPVRTHAADGLRFFEYERQRLVSWPAPAGYGFGRFGRYGYNYGTGPLVETRACAVTFTLRGDRVAGFTRRGDDCLAVPPSA